MNGESTTPLSRRQEVLHRVESFLFWGLVGSFGRSYRLRPIAGEAHLERLRRDGEAAVIAFWHDRLFFASYLVSRQLIRRGYPVTGLISASRDGELAARTAVRLGAGVVRGSSSRGASRGFRALLRAAVTGGGLLVVPDGPRGPAHRAKPGVVTLARLIGAPVVPLAWKADRSWRLGSWDRLEIPKPFARVAVAIGEPRLVPRELDEPGLSRQISALEEELASLDALAAEALSAG